MNAITRAVAVMTGRAADDGSLPRSEELRAEIANITEPAELDALRVAAAACQRVVERLAVERGGAAPVRRAEIDAELPVAERAAAKAARAATEFAAKHSKLLSRVDALYAELGSTVLAERAERAERLRAFATGEAAQTFAAAAESFRAAVIEFGATCRACDLASGSAGTSNLQVLGRLRDPLEVAAAVEWRAKVIVEEWAG